MQKERNEDFNFEEQETSDEQWDENDMETDIWMSELTYLQSLQQINQEYYH